MGDLAFPLPEMGGAYRRGHSRSQKWVGRIGGGLIRKSGARIRHVRWARILPRIRLVLLGLVLVVVTTGIATAAPVTWARAYRSFTSAGVPRDIDFSPDSSLLATSSADGSISLYRVGDGRLVRRLVHSGGVTSIDFSPDGRWLASGGYDRTVRLWRTSDGSHIRTLKEHTGTVWSVAFSPNGRTVASSGEDATIRLWSVSDGAVVRTLRGHSLNVWSIAFAPDGMRLVSGSFDRSVAIWRTDSGDLERRLLGHGQAVVGVAFSPDGRLVASGSDDSSVRLWRVRDGSLVDVLSGENHVYSVAFSPDGDWLAAAGRESGTLGTLWRALGGGRLHRGDGVSARLWRVHDGWLQQELSGHEDDVRFIDFSPDQRWLATSSEDGTVKLWRLEQRP